MVRSSEVKGVLIAPRKALKLLSYYYLLKGQKSTGSQGSNNAEAS